MTQAQRCNVLLICGGKYHDIDFARLELLKLLAEHDHLRVVVRDDYRDLQALAGCDLLITYTCDVVPGESQLPALEQRLREGLRWFALHGTNSVLQFLHNGRVDTPPLPPALRRMLGSQFVGHPPIGRFRVEVTDPRHPLVAGIDAFDIEDEPYLLEADDVQCLLHTEFEGRIKGFVKRDWPRRRHPVFYLQPRGRGGVLYLTLGHCRGHYDMLPLLDYYPKVERCAWESPVYYELLRRGIRWAQPPAGSQR